MYPYFEFMANVPVRIFLTSRKEHTLCPCMSAPMMNKHELLCNLYGIHKAFMRK
jgi:hypothetical protein